MKYLSRSNIQVQKSFKTLLLLKVSTLALLGVTAFTITGCLKTDEDSVQEIPEPLKVVSYMALGTPSSQVAMIKKPENHQTVTTLSNHTKPSIRTLSGQVVPAETTNISFESSGKVKTIYKKLGDSVNKGDVLADINPINYQLQLSQAQSRLNQAQSQYGQAQSQLNQSKSKLNQAIDQRNKAKIDVKRREKLVPIGAVSQTEVDSVLLTLRSAENQVNVAKNQIQVAEGQVSVTKNQVQAAAASVELIKKQYQDTQLKAPFNGVVTAQLSEVGQMVSPSVPVFTIASDEQKEIRVSVPESLIPSISIGQPMLVNFPALHVQTRGQVTEVSSQANAGSFPVTIRLNNPSKAIRSGMTAEVAFQMLTKQNHLNSFNDNHNKNDNNVERNGTKIQDITHNRFLVPPSAIAASDNPDNSQSSFVYRINHIDKSTSPIKGKLEKVNVKIIDMSTDGMTILGLKTNQKQNNLNPGDIIVRTGVTILHNEQEVELMGTGAKRINP